MPYHVLQALEKKGARAGDVSVLSALWNIFKTFSQPREELSSPASSSDSQPPHSSNGELSQYFDSSSHRRSHMPGDMAFEQTPISALHLWPEQSLVLHTCHSASLF